MPYSIKRNTHQVRIIKLTPYNIHITFSQSAFIPRFLGVSDVSCVSRNLRLYIVLIGVAKGTGLFGPIDVQHLAMKTRGNEYEYEGGHLQCEPSKDHILVTSAMLSLIVLIMAPPVITISSCNLFSLIFIFLADLRLGHAKSRHLLQRTLS